MDASRSFPGGAAPRAVVLNGARDGEPEIDALAGAVRAELERLGLDVEPATLRELTIAPCLGCFRCWTWTPGACRTHDAGRELARACARARLLAFVTPVTFGGYSSELKKAVDRLLCLVLPFFTRVRGEVHHPFRYARPAALVVIGVVRERVPAQERIFHELVRRNAANFRAPAFASHVVDRAGAADGPTPALRDVLAGVLDASKVSAPRVALSGGLR